jgi:hypothetical protein
VVDNKPYKFWVLLQYPTAKAVNHGHKKFVRRNGKVTYSKDRWCIKVGNKILGQRLYEKPNGDVYRIYNSTKSAYSAWKQVALNMHTYEDGNGKDS